MKLIAQSSVAQSLQSISRLRGPSIFAQRCLHTTSANPATVQPITASGPPPTAPTPSAEHVDARVARRRKQAELLERGRDMRAVAAGTGGGSAKTKRFWQDVHVTHTDEGLQIYLDKRPIRRPSKDILTVPHHKPHLANAIALEWDLLVSAQQALRVHLIPMTSLVSRALDIIDEDTNSPSSEGSIRASIIKTVMRYLDTDSLLCWAPEAAPDPPGYETHAGRVESLRSIQKRTAEPIVQYLTERVWPGVEIIPVLDSDSIMPKSQPQMTKDVIQGWVSGLPAFELAGLERAVLASKGLLIAARIIVEWSAELKHLREDAQPAEKFGVEEAAKAASTEVNWQTDMWGEVEDTHDVAKEDVRRQLGSVVLLVSGERA
ncbi:ATP12 ATPase family protein [Phlyctema vagabunda]|uniref:ATP12 ATPase family protein n=1 Tax=Phlyctema vagabunda TaxID=108571 RepID=A0ABR4PT42_9HELO